jgi:hypothetical protein
MAFQSVQGMDQPTRLVQGAANSELAFVRVSWKILTPCLKSILGIFVNDVRVKCPKSRYAAGMVEGLAGVQRFIMEHIQNLDTIFANVD